MNGEQAPFSQTVGREFVRQYYTMFGNGPKYVHRFYNSESIYVRGDVIVTGQQSIEKEIESLNLKDSHTKIRAVDAHSTIGNGYVVQVIGEISMNGGSYRLFVQTFVLAPQTPKKYYVHNDTLKFLDDFFNENPIGCHENFGSEGDRHPASSSVEHFHNQIHSEQQPLPIFDTGNKSHSGNNNGRPLSVGQTSYENGTGCHENLNHGNEGDQRPASSSAEHFHDQLLSEQQQRAVYDKGNESHSGDNNGRPLSVGETSSGTPEEMDEQQSAENIKQSTWASRVGSKSGGGGGGGGYTQQPGSFPSIQSTQAVLNGQALIGNKGIPASYASDGFKPPITVHPGNIVRPFEQPRAATSSNMGMQNVQRQGSLRGKMYHDQNVSFDQQIFVGNLPADVEQKDLIEKLTPYGNISNVSIVAKPNVAPYAFVTFESSESVVKILEAQTLSIFIRTNRITIEKKRGPQSDQRLLQNRNDSMNGSMPRMTGMNQRGGIVRMPYQRGGGAPFTRVSAPRTFRNGGQMSNHYAGGNMMPK